MLTPQAWWDIAWWPLHELVMNPMHCNRGPCNLRNTLTERSGIMPASADTIMHTYEKRAATCQVHHCYACWGRILVEHGAASELQVAAKR